MAADGQQMPGNQPPAFMTQSKMNMYKSQMYHVSDQEHEAWELIKDIPDLGKVRAYACAILNLLFAGTGTMLSAFLVPNMDKTQFIVGFSQMLLGPWLIGIFWSYYWAYLFVIGAGKSGNQESAPLVGGGANSSSAQI